MSIECNNTTPLSSRVSELTAPTTFVDLGPLLSSTDPLSDVNRRDIIEVTDRLNTVLPFLDLSNVETLSDRFGQFPLTYTEIADWTLNNSVDVPALKSALNAFTVVAGPDVNVSNALEELDFYYNANLGKSISEGLCGKFGNALTELIGLFSLIDSTIAKLNSLKLSDFDLKKLSIAELQKKIVEEFREKILETIDKLIEKIKEKVKKAIKKAIEDIKNFISNPGQTILNQLTKIQKEIDDFFSEENIQAIKDRVEEFLTEMAAGFERLTLANVQLIMHKLCNFTEIIQRILFGPADEVAELAKVIDKENKVLDTVDAVAKKNAEEAGATRVDKEQAEAVKEQSANSVNTKALDNNPNRYVELVPRSTTRGTRFDEVVKYRQPGDLNYIDPSTGRLAIPTNVDYITSRTITPQEIEAINNLDPNTGLASGLITFSDAVKSGKQYEDVANEVWSKLLRISHLTGEKYVLRQGAVKPAGGRGGVKARAEYGKIRSQGSSGYHHRYSGYAVVLEVNDEQRENAIIAASRAGFTGIGVAKNFLRLNLGARDGTVATTDNPQFTQSERFTKDEAPIYENMMKIHRIDGYRKKRKMDQDFRFFDPTTFKAEEKEDNTFSFTDNNDILGANVEDVTEPFSLLRPDN
jgi:hypothetical protein